MKIVIFFFHIVFMCCALETEANEPSMAQLYDDLGLNPKASDSDLREAYYKLATELDAHKLLVDPLETEKFLKMSNAYFELLDTEIQAGYDKSRKDLTTQTNEENGSGNHGVYYTALGVLPDATALQIKEGFFYVYYRETMYHGGNFGLSSDGKISLAKIMWKEQQRAYNVLRDPELKDLYDENLKDAAKHDPTKEKTTVHYDMLGVSPEATDFEIEEGFHTQYIKYFRHFNAKFGYIAVGESADAKEIWVRLQRSYNVLNRPYRRALYDKNWRDAAKQKQRNDETESHASGEDGGSHEGSGDFVEESKLGSAAAENDKNEIPVREGGPTESWGSKRCRGGNKKNDIPKAGKDTATRSRTQRGKSLGIAAILVIAIIFMIVLWMLFRLNSKKKLPLPFPFPSCS